MTRFLFLFAALLCLAACAAPPAPDPDGAVLIGFEALPKSLATVVLTETPDPGIAQTATRAALPTTIPLPPTFTPTPTPYLGVFMGNLTPEPGVVYYPPGAYRHPGNSSASVGVIPFNSGNPGVGVPVMTTPGAAIPTFAAGVSGGGSAAAGCSQPPVPPFVNAANNATVQSRIGCPAGGAFTTRLVTQPFQGGVMFWRDTREIYVLSTAAVAGQGIDIYWRMNDAWNEGMPADDPAFIPPAGFLQPVRGFGFVWRNNQGIRDRLGWALGGEQPYDATLQPFERGFMITGIDGRIWALVANPDPNTGTHFGALSP